MNIRDVIIEDLKKRGYKINTPQDVKSGDLIYEDMFKSIPIKVEQEIEENKLVITRSFVENFAAKTSPPSHRVLIAVNVDNNGNPNLSKSRVLYAGAIRNYFKRAEKDKNLKQLAGEDVVYNNHLDTFRYSMTYEEWANDPKDFIPEKK